MWVIGPVRMLGMSVVKSKESVVISKRPQTAMEGRKERRKTKEKKTKEEKENK